MIQDHYAILGVAPNAPQAVIRAAYLALMREHHPDRNPTRSATERAQAIIAAYKILGDFDRRQHYDWDRRRERDAAAALAAAPEKRRFSPGVVAAGAIGLAAIGAVLLRPGPEADRLPASPPSVEQPKAKAEPVRKKKRIAVAARSKAAKPAEAKPRPEPVQLAIAEKPAPKRVPPEPARMKTSVAQAPSARPKPDAAVAARVRPKPVVSVAMAVPPKNPPKSKAAPKRVAAATPPTGSDIASLDQFVMSFYGQSWRFGDARKRAALQQSRDSFVVRRGACLADSCKRAAYLKLMRDVSAIVESGQPLR